MTAVILHPGQDPLTARGLVHGTCVHLEFDIVDILAVLQAIRAGILHSSNLRGGLRTRVLALHEFLLDQLPPEFRTRILQGRFLG